MSNQAFDFLREHKKVEPDAEHFFMKRVGNKMSTHEILACFENGISGAYGKLYQADAATLIGWADIYRKEQFAPKNYLSSSLAALHYKSSEPWDWEQEANKCYQAFLNNTPITNFHPCVYDNMMLSGKIKLNSYLEFYKGMAAKDITLENWDKVKEEVYREVTSAKQKVLGEVFKGYRQQGFTTVYFIN